MLCDRFVCAFRTHSSACFVTGEFVKLPTIMTTTTMMIMMMMMTNLQSTAKRGSIGTESVSNSFAYRLSGRVPQSTQIQKLKQEGTIVRFSNNTRKMPSTLCFPIFHKKKQECKGLYNTPALWLHTTFCLRDTNNLNGST